MIKSGLAWISAATLISWVLLLAMCCKCHHCLSLLSLEEGYIYLCYKCLYDLVYTTIQLRKVEKLNMEEEEIFLKKMCIKVVQWFMIKWKEKEESILLWMTMCHILLLQYWIHNRDTTWLPINFLLNNNNSYTSRIETSENNHNIIYYGVLRSFLFWSVAIILGRKFTGNQVVSLLCIQYCNSRIWHIVIHSKMLSSFSFHLIINHWYTSSSELSLPLPRSTYLLSLAV